MTVIKAHKINMNMSYREYLENHPDATKEEREAIIEKFVKNLQDGPLLEIIKFFNLDDDDILELKKDNFAIGFKIRKDNEGDHSYDLSIRLDVRVEEPNPLGGDTPDIANLMSGMANMITPTTDEGEVVFESEASEVAEEAEEAPVEEEVSEEAEEDPSEEITEEADVEEATEEAPVEEETEEETPVEG